jgi:integrase
VKAGKWEPLGKDLADALDAYAKKIETPKGGMADLIDRAFVQMKPKLSANTIAQYTQAAERLKVYLVEFSPNQVKQKHVAAIKVKLSSTPNMANRVISFLRKVFSYAVEWQEADSNPCLGIQRHTEAKRKRYITDAEFMAIYDKAGERLQIVMDLCYLTAQRVSDVLAIKLSDITDDGILFRPKKTLNSTGASLIVRWTPPLRATVDRAKALHVNGNIRALIPTLLFNRKRKAPDYGTTKFLWDAARTAAGVEDVHIHDLRAKSLTDTKGEGGDPQALASHSSAAMTARYIRLRETPQVAGPSKVLK